MEPRIPNTRRAFSRAAAVLAGLLAVCQLAAVAHLTLVVHATCAVHGESIHATAQHQTAPATPVADDVEVVLTTAGEHGADEHCAIPGHPGGHGVGLMAPTATLHHRAGEAPVMMAPRGWKRPAARLWQTAPKTSPPRLG